MRRQSLAPSWFGTDVIWRAIVQKVRRMFLNLPLWFAINTALFVALLGVHFSCPLKPDWWADAFSVAINILAGGIVSFFFYWLVVYLPDRRKRRVIKNTLSRMYRSIRKDILYQVVFASIKGGRKDLQADAETIDKLMTPAGFRAAFDGGHQGDQGFYAFANQMSEETIEYRGIIENLEMLGKQIEFVLYNYTICDEEFFGYFKNLELILLELQRSKPGYDESKRLCRFIYEMFSGFNWIEGHRGYDPIEKMIAEI